MKKIIYNIFFTLKVDTIDSLNNKLVRSIGELMQNQVQLVIKDKVKNLEFKLKNTLQYAASGDFSKLEKSVIRYFNLTQGFYKFFSVNPLSQIMDDTNPLSELTHKRRISSFGLGGLTKDNVKLEVREIYPSYFGRVCPIETSEGKNAGLVLSLAKNVRINNFGFIESPFYF
jgi:DNA-directed RNA polymerase beta subunit